MTTILVAFAGTWVTDPTTGASVQAFKVDRKETDTLTGARVAVYAGGRTRVITTPADSRVSAVVFRAVSETDKDTLRDWRGRVLLLRDPSGWRRWGSYLAVDVSPIAKMQPTYDVAFTWTDLSYTEGV
jgi:hypothetical protein